MGINKSSQVNPLVGAWPPQLSGLLRILSGSGFRHAPPRTTVPTAAESTPCPLALTESIPSGQSFVLCLSLIGELNCHSYTYLVESACAHYRQGQRALLLDLSQTTAIELSGFFALLNIARLYSGKPMLDPDEGWEAIRGPMRSTNPVLGKYVKLLSPSPQACAALERAAFCSFFEQFTELDKAIAAFSIE